MTTSDERLLDLMVARATEGLDAPETVEMERLLGRQSEWRADDLELAAAEVQLRSVEDDLEPMPSGCRRRLLDAADEFVAGATGVPAAPVTSLDDARRARRGGFDLRGLGWYAAAAMLVLAIWAPWSTRTPIEPPPMTDAVTLRAQLIADCDDLVTAVWGAAESEYDGVSGDVVWSSSRQAGFMRLRGLAPNLPSERQYQLWIVDPSRDAEPVDGGVFDVPSSGGEIIVPIDAKLQVADPTVFAITLEQPGGVVVSEGPLLVVAQPA